MHKFKIPRKGIFYVTMTEIEKFPKDDLLTKHQQILEKGLLAYFKVEQLNGKIAKRDVISLMKDIMDIGVDLEEFVDKNMLVDMSIYKDHLQDWHCAYRMVEHLLEASDTQRIEAEIVRRIAAECYPYADELFRLYLMQSTDEMEEENK